MKKENLVKRLTFYEVDAMTNSEIACAMGLKTSLMDDLASLPLMPEIEEKFTEIPAYLVAKLNFILTLLQFHWKNPNGYNILRSNTSLIESFANDDSIDKVHTNFINTNYGRIIITINDSLTNDDSQAPYIIDCSNLQYDGIHFSIKRLVAQITNIPFGDIILTEQELKQHIDYISEQWQNKGFGDFDGKFIEGNPVAFYLLLVGTTKYAKKYLTEYDEADRHISYSSIGKLNAFNEHINKIAKSSIIGIFSQLMMKFYDKDNNIIMLQKHNIGYNINFESNNFSTDSKLYCVPDYCINLDADDTWNHTFRGIGVINEQSPKSFSNISIGNITEQTESNEPSDFVSIANKQIELYKKKNKDYGNATDKLFKKYGFTYYKIMIEQKLQRIDSIVNNGDEHNFESLEDSLLDMSNYCLLAVESLRKKKQCE